MVFHNRKNKHDSAKTEISLKINYLKFCSNLPGANGLTHLRTWIHNQLITHCFVRDIVTQPRVGQLMWKVSKIRVLLCPWVAWLDTVSQSNHPVSGHVHFVGESCWRPMTENDQNKWTQLPMLTNLNLVKIIHIDSITIMLWLQQTSQTWVAAFIGPIREHC